MKIRPWIRQQLIQTHIEHLSNCHYVDQTGIGWTPGSRLTMLQLLICEPGKVGIIGDELLTVAQSRPSALYVHAHYYGVFRPSTRYLRMCHRAKIGTRNRLLCLTGNTISVRHHRLSDGERLLCSVLHQTRSLVGVAGFSTYIRDEQRGSSMQATILEDYANSTKRTNL